LPRIKLINYVQNITYKYNVKCDESTKISEHSNLKTHLFTISKLHFHSDSSDGNQIYHILIAH